MDDAGNYFHHQVLAYRGIEAMGERWTGPGTTSQDLRVKKKGWQKGRTGSAEAYNTDYVESEFEIMAQGFVTLETDRYLAELNDKYGVYNQTKQAAKDWNEAAVRKIAKQQARRLGIPEGEEPDPFAQFSQKIAIGFSKIQKMLDDGILDIPPRFQSFADFMSRDAEGSHGQLFPFLAWNLDNETAAAPAAAMIFKAIGERNQFVKDTLGDNFKTYHDMIPQGS
jgi:hypothetical protein